MNFSQEGNTMKGCRVLNRNEVSTLRADANPRDNAFLLTGLTFGLRVSESLALTFGDVSGMFLNVKSKKCSENVTFPIPTAYREAINTLQNYYAEQGIEVTADTFLFLSRKGTNKAITRQQASQIMQKLADKAGLDGKVNTHSLRKSFVTDIYAKSGHDIAETKKYSRHKNMANLDYYIGTTEGTELIHALAW